MVVMHTVLRFRARGMWRRFAWGVVGCLVAVACEASGPSLPKGAWHAPVHAALQAAIERHSGDPDAYAVFDFDMTWSSVQCPQSPIGQVMSKSNTA